MRPSFPFACPACHTSLEQTGPDTLRCPDDGLRFQRLDGVWRFLLPGRAAGYEQFIREYETVRRAEGRAARDPAYYRALPYRDPSGRMSADWRIRAASFDVFLAKVLAPLEHIDIQKNSFQVVAPERSVSQRSRSDALSLSKGAITEKTFLDYYNNAALNILDLGAGNGWLSNRLAGRGHTVAAVDLMTNDFDGLGCYRYYETAFTPAQAEFDRLPFPDGAADLVIFNASLHYSVDIHDTLKEALRVLEPAGRLVILDSPFYQNPKSGAQMVQEREAAFLKQYGFRSNALPSKNYLTYDDLDELGATLNLHWQILTPFYGLAWALRPLKARLLRRREPARFHVVVGMV